MNTNLKSKYEYVTAPHKTDASRFGYCEKKIQLVSAINCPKERPLERFISTQQSYSFMKTISSYHAFQSFVGHEVSPFEAHIIGIETIKKAFGDKYEVIVATHMNKPNIHNHFLINSVSLIDGISFELTPLSIYKLRTVSDSICINHHVSTIATSFKRAASSKSYWVQKNHTLDSANISSPLLEEIALSPIVSTCPDGINNNFSFITLGQKKNKIQSKVSSFELTNVPFLDNFDFVKFDCKSTLITSKVYDVLDYYVSFSDYLDHINSIDSFPIYYEFRNELQCKDVFCKYSSFLKENGLSTISEINHAIKSKTNELSSYESQLSGLLSSNGTVAQRKEKCENLSELKSTIGILEAIRYKVLESTIILEIEHLLESEYIEKDFNRLRKNQHIELSTHLSKSSQQLEAIPPRSFLVAR